MGRSIFFPVLLGVEIEVEVGVGLGLGLELELAGLIEQRRLLH